MGANLSVLGSEIDGDNPPSRLRLGDIPESCVASVLIHLDPPDICSLARLNRAFRGASSADFIWEEKLPPNYRAIVEKVFDEPKMANLRKKEIYAKFCAPIPFDCGTKELWLDKRTGGVCLSISSKALTITGINDRRYWNHISTEQSRFNTVAYLQQIWWLEVNGELDFPFPVGTYRIFFRLQLGKPGKRLGRSMCNPDQIHGWDIKPVRFELTTSDGQHSASHCYLDNIGSWVYYHIGDFVVKKSDEWTSIHFSMTQIDCTHTKGGLCLDTVFICQSSLGKFDSFLDIGNNHMRLEESDAVRSTR